MLEYQFCNLSEPGLADGRISVSVAIRYQTAKLFWADQDGALADYLMITELLLRGGTATYEIVGKRWIPQGATRLICEVTSNIDTTLLEYNLPKEKLQPKVSENYNFFLFSDMHGGGDYWQNKQNRDAAFSDAASFLPSHIIVSGDITNAGQPEHYQKVKDDVQKFFPNTPVLFATGNHDYNSYRPDVEADLTALNDFFAWQIKRNTTLNVMISSGDNYNFVASIDGICYIFLNASAPNNIFLVRQEQRDWLEQTLRDCHQNGTPVFVINHFPIKGKTGLHSLFHKRFIEDNDEVESILNRHQCIYVSGHTHYNIDSDQSSVNVGENGQPSYINAGCVVWTQNGYDEDGKDVFVRDRCMGQFIEVYDDYLLIRGRDFTNKKFIPKCEYRIPLK